MALYLGTGYADRKSPWHVNRSIVCYQNRLGCFANTPRRQHPTAASKPQSDTTLPERLGESRLGLATSNTSPWPRVDSGREVAMR